MASYSQEDIIKGIHSGKYSKYDLPRDLFEFTYEELAKAVDLAFVGVDFEKDARRAEIVDMLRSNIAFFSGAKTFTQVNLAMGLLYDDKGYKLKFKEFKEIVKPIDDIFNKTWLKTEHDTAFGQSQSANIWRKYEEEKDIFPYLKYQTALDERVRHDHKQWDNLIFKVDHPFWDTRMPLNGYNCRCRVIQLTDGKESSYKKAIKNKDKTFANNVGKTGEIFTKKHPYFKVKKEDLPLTKNNFGLGTDIKQ